MRDIRKMMELIDGRNSRALQVVNSGVWGRLLAVNNKVAGLLPLVSKVAAVLRVVRRPDMTPALIIASGITGGRAGEVSD